MMSSVICELCPRYCAIPEGGAGDCRVRVNLEGKLIATTFGRPSSVHIDPMEKKPLFHFLPGSPIFSIATAGCNLHCKNCQNWQLSQRSGAEMEEIYNAPPQRVVATARQQRCQSIAYTYSEPLVFYEYVRETSLAAREVGLKNVLVSAGYVNREPLQALSRLLDAANVDLKAFDDRFYREVCGATLQPVLDALVILKEAGVWLEITNLIIPTLNDDLSMVRRMARWIHNELGPRVPLHLSRFHPQYRMQNLPPTPGEILIRCRNEALEVGLEHVYIGNLLGNEGESTRCPRDNTLLIERAGFRIQQNNLLPGGVCPTCQQAIAGVWT
ncbi:MAG: AmmeMemoRadiSam system radical SAM enzyme [Magnetococcales bacterium]|nr:AmmeMemoRadiSam system radical SAM enzyme [Magnetococcales bacterium]